MSTDREALQARLLFVFVVTVCAALGALAGCDTNSCVARGKMTTYSGAVTYSVHFDSGDVVAAKETSALTTNDYDEDCTYDGEEFPITIKGCIAWVHYNTSGDSSGGDDDDNSPQITSSSIESGQTCSVDVSGGTATVTITQGNLLSGTGYAASSFDAKMTAWNGVAQTGTLHLDFSGN